MEVIRNFSDLDLTKTYTYFDYLKWELDERVELIYGKVVAMESTSTNHQIILMNLVGNFHPHRKERNFKFFMASFDVRLNIDNTNLNVVQPDALVVLDNSIIDEQGCNGNPDLVIEIILPITLKHDTKTKFDLYEKAGIKEYWMIYATSQIVFIYILQNGKYIGLKPVCAGCKIESHVLPSLNLSYEQVFDNLINFN